MIKTNLHIKDVFFIPKLTALSYIIFFISSFFWGEFTQLLADERLSSAPDVIIPFSQHRVTKTIASSMVIYDRREETLVKRDELIRQQSDFLFIDTHAMALAIYQKGQLVKTFSIVAKGAEGTFFEIPNGLYTVAFKEEKHHSTIGDIFMPWTIALSDNYMIHGMPLHANGAAIESSSIGGGIRLATKDAKEIFGFARIEMPVLLFGKGNQEQRLARYFQKIPIAAQRRTVPPSNNIPGLSAISAFAADVETGEIFFEKQKNAVRPIASVTKLMTALIALDSVDPSTRLVINEQAVNTSGDTGKLRLGDRFPAKDLLYPLLLSSSNDAAVAYAEHVENFVELMNKKAQEISLAYTFYKDPTGLAPENVSTVQDLFTLIAYINKHQKQILDITSLPEYAIASDNKLHAWRNNTWPDNNGIFLGGKFGFTPEARQTLAAVFGITMSEFSARPIAIVLLGSNDRRRDVTLITDHIRKNFAYGSTLAEKEGSLSFHIMHVGMNIFETLKK